MQKTTLLIMAVGISSRYTKGIKQLESVGMHGELMADHSPLFPQSIHADRETYHSYPHNDAENVQSRLAPGQMPTTNSQLPHLCRHGDKRVGRGTEQKHMYVFAIPSRQAHLQRTCK